MTRATNQDDGLSSHLRRVAPEARKRVVVAMSGGVDSSVVAAMLHAQGHDVIGITLQLYDHGAAVQKAGACCAGQDIHDARRVAETAGFAHYVLDYESRFKSAVIDAFADSYLAGETPIPCVNCNQQVKFRDLLDTARDLGADVLATGHYIARRDIGGEPAMVRAHDAARDQSYFLFGTTRDQLRQLWFPLGDLPKSDVRRLADLLGLAVKNKPDSQDICFVPNGRYADVIAKLRPDATEPGDIVHVDGRVMGQHNGIINFTVGQRRGLGVATGEPLFVVAINAHSNQVFVGPRSALDTTSLNLRDVNWIGDGTLDDAVQAHRAVYARVRSTQEPVPARLTRGEDGGIVVALDTPSSGVSKGQACVFYDAETARSRVLGGGWISDTTRVATAKTGAGGQTATASARV